MNNVSSKILKNSLFIYIGRLINLTISFFIFIHIANYLGENLFGRFSIAITYVAVFSILSNFGLNQILVRELSAKHFSTDVLLSNAVMLKLLFSFVSICLAWLLTFFSGYPKKTIVLIFIISLNLILSPRLSSTRTIFEAYFQSKLQMVFPIFFNFIDKVLFAILIYFFTVKYKVNLLYVSLIYVLSNLPGAILLVIKFLKSISIKFYIQYATIKYFIIESFPLFLYILFSTLNTKIDILLLSWMRGNEEVGYFSAAIRIVYPLMFFSTSFSISLFPILSKFFRENNEKFLKFLKTGMKYILIITIFLSTTLTFHAEKIILTFYNATYAPSINSFKILIIALGFYFLVFYFVDIFIAARRQKLITMIMAIALAINIGLNLLLIPKLGFIGASYIRVITYLSLLIMFFILITFRLKITRIIEYGKMSILIMLYIIVQLIIQKFSLLLSLSLSLIIFSASIIILRVISNEEIQIVKKIFKNQKKQRNQIFWETKS